MAIPNARVAVGLLLVRKEGEVLFTRRNGRWSIPFSYLENDTLQEAVQRICHDCSELNGTLKGLSTIVEIPRRKNQRTPFLAFIFVVKPLPEVLALEPKALWQKHEAVWLTREMFDRLLAKGKMFCPSLQQTAFSRRGTLSQCFSNIFASWLSRQAGDE